MECLDSTENHTKPSRSLFNSWRSGGAAIAGASNNFSFYQIMATSSGILRDCTHITFNETIKSHNSVTFKLVKTGELDGREKKPFHMLPLGNFFLFFCHSI